MSFEIDLEKKTVQFHIEVNLEDLYDHLTAISKNRINEKDIKKYFNENYTKLIEYINLCENLMMAYGTFEIDDEDVVIDFLKAIEKDIKPMEE